jgi:hypothetical protein
MKYHDDSQADEMIFNVLNVPNVPKIPERIRGFCNGIMGEKSLTIHPLSCHVGTVSSNFVGIPQLLFGSLLYRSMRQPTESDSLIWHGQ